MVMSKLNNRVVIITGGGSGIGKATAARFLKEGAIVYINGRKELKLIDACNSLREVSGTVAYVQGDVSKVADCKKIVTEVADREGRIDVVVNSAGVWIEGPSEMMTEELWDRCIDINLKGTFFCLQILKVIIKSSLRSIPRDIGPGLRDQKR
jgi:NAD(P)-dependent dehydrogenase (short-subunit alcohol dehydrogenase family)